MMLPDFKKSLSNHLINIPGWNTKRKYIVIESDDWGSVRMPSKACFEALMQKGIAVDRCPYNSNDSIASQEDLNVLFDMLENIKAVNGNHPIFTFNTIVANPDFEKIEKANFSNYFYEPFTETLKKYYPDQEVFETWKIGMEKGVMHPQFHGREHLNVIRWMKALQDNLPETKFAFQNSLFGISTTITSEKRKSYLPAFDFDDVSELTALETVLTEGTAMFESIFGFRSESFIAPNYTWHSKIESHLKKVGIYTIQGARAQQEPTDGKIKVKKHSMGSFNQNDQVYLIRNVIFEPALNKNIDWIKSVLNQIAIAFFWNKPAVISSHRLNYIGTLNEENRSYTITLLKIILSEVVKKWPEVEFITSDELGRIILNSKNENT